MKHTNILPVIQITSRNNNYSMDLGKSYNFFNERSNKIPHNIFYLWIPQKVEPEETRRDSSRIAIISFHWKKANRDSVPIFHCNNSAKNYYLIIFYFQKSFRGFIFFNEKHGPQFKYICLPVCLYFSVCYLSVVLLARNRISIPIANW